MGDIKNRLHIELSNFLEKSRASAEVVTTDEWDFESASSAIPTRRHFAGQRMYYTMPSAKNQAKAAEGTRRRREVCEFYKENRPFL